MIIDDWEKFEEVIELIKGNLPINMQVEWDDACKPDRNTQPLPFDPRIGSATSVPTPPPALAEVRVSLFIDDKLGWLLPVRFCLGQLLTATEIIGKIGNAFGFLRSWSYVHASAARERLRLEHCSSAQNARSVREPLIQ